MYFIQIYVIDGRRQFIASVTSNLVDEEFKEMKMNSDLPTLSLKSSTFGVVIDLMF